MCMRCVAVLLREMHSLCRMRLCLCYTVRCAAIDDALRLHSCARCRAATVSRCTGAAATAAMRPLLNPRTAMAFSCGGGGVHQMGGKPVGLDALPNRAFWAE